MPNTQGQKAHSYIWPEASPCKRSRCQKVMTDNSRCPRDLKTFQSLKSIAVKSPPSINAVVFRKHLLTVFNSPKENMLELIFTGFWDIRSLNAKELWHN